MLLSFRNSAVGDIVSNALLKSNSKAIVISFLSRPDLISSVILSKAVVVLWCRRKPVCNGSRMPLLIIYSDSCLCTNFSRTLERKQSNAIGRKSEAVVGADFFFKDNNCAFFQDPGKAPLSSDVLNMLTSRGAMVGRAFAITLCGMPSSPLA